MYLVWLGLLGVLVGGYFCLAGYDYGIGVLLPVLARTEDERRVVLGTFGPFFLGNEVWLVAAVGVLFGAFPSAEGMLLSGAYPVVLAAVLGVVLVSAGVQLRSRRPADRHRLWDIVIAVGGGLAAVGWGALLGALTQGLPIDSNEKVTRGVGSLLTPFTALAGFTVFGLFLLHGTAFLGLRLDGRLAARARRQGLLLVSPVAVLVAVCAGWAALATPVRQPVPAAIGVLTLLGSVLAAGRAMAGRRPRTAFGLTALATVLPVLIVGLGNYPAIVVSTVDPAGSLSVAGAAAAAETLTTLLWFALPVLPAVLGFQWMSWWAARHRGVRYF